MALRKINLPPSGVRFNEDEHRYFKEDGTELRGITSTIVDWMFPDTYANVPDFILEEAARRGKYIHSCIEMADAVGVPEDCPECGDYLRLMKEHHMTAIAHEYIVTDQDNFASPIDIVLQDENGDVWLADVKTTYALNEPKVTLQLSIYRAWFEAQTGEKVKGVIEVWLPKDRKKKAAFIFLPMVSIEDTYATIEAYLAGEEYANYLPLYDKTAEQNLPKEFVNAMRQVEFLERQIKDIKEQEEQLKEFLLEKFRSSDMKKIENDKISITYIEPTTKVSVDTKKLKEQHADVYEDCLKTSSVKDSVKITIKKG